MDANRLAKVIITDLKKVAVHGPNERLPKEEQIRCAIFNYLKPNAKVVCAEKGYKSIDKGGRAECDLWMKGKDNSISWFEIKVAWATKYFENKVTQFNTWTTDINKLIKVTSNNHRYFILVGFFDFNPLNKKAKICGPGKNKIIDKIRSVFPEQICGKPEIKTFTWRKRSYSKSITHIGVWIRHWPKGSKI
jgi:hypothetical protein